ncbi:unnamed protein product [Prorocentrum cordatum]|uniref:Uncharacterized protein n=1 Tax=Prorocentrum cordatum TaxID=2364126 RepID=A0ABN9Y1M4_9DINO|nr:unnamed protein product [Polarella glacialis]
MAEAEGARSAARNPTARQRWGKAGALAKNMVRQAKVVADVTSALAAESGEWPFYLTAPRGGAKIYTTSEMVDQFIDDDVMQQLENRCVCALDVDDEVLDLLKTMGESTVDVVFDAHAQVIEFLRARRAASARKSLDVGLANRRTSLALAQEERDRLQEQAEARDEDDNDVDHELLALEEDMDAQTSGRSGKAQMFSGRSTSMESMGSTSATSRSTALHRRHRGHHGHGFLASFAPQS